jgi:hypothetical protein
MKLIQKIITTLNNIEKIYSTLLFLFLSVASAQAPSSYYSTATGNKLHFKTTIQCNKGHTDQGMLDSGFYAVG